MKRTLAIFGFLALGFLVVPSAYALTTDQDVLLVLPGDSSNYVLESGATFDTLTINSTSFSFDMSSSQSFKMHSSDRKNLTNDAGTATASCDSSQSSVIISSDTSQTVTITPSGTCSSSDSGSNSSSGGGGTPGTGGPNNTMSSGGSGGSGSSITTSTPTPTPTPSTTVTPMPSFTDVSAPYGTPAPIQKPVTGFLKMLFLDSEGDDVLMLQAMLAADKKIYPEGKITGYFGPMTQKAVKRFQDKWGLTAFGDEEYGMVGTKTIQKLNELLAAPATNVVNDQVPPSTQSLTRNLGAGSRGKDVESLQMFLQMKGFLAADVTISGYYGKLTAAAVGKFQEEEGITKPGQTGYGRVGPRTLARINQVIAGY